MRWTGWLENWSEDERAGDLQMVDSKSFSVGHNLATTPGSVVFRNELIELIHYAPVTEQVHAVPLVFVPPWINKFYILDLNEKKSMVRYLLKQGFSVFVISWRNPDASMANTTFEDYVLKGVLAAIEAARALCGVPQVHAIGYCLGGTTLATLMAWLNREYEGKPGMPVSTLRPAVSNSLLSRIKKASLPMTNTAEAPGAVATLSPGFTAAPALAGLPLISTSPLTSTMPLGRITAARASRSSSGMAAPPSSARFNHSRRVRSIHSLPCFIYQRRGTVLFSPQLPPQDLANGRLRQAVAEFDVLRNLVAGKLSLAVLDHGFFGQVRILFHDHHLHRLA